MAQIEPMDIDSEFDNKENSLHHSNVLSRTPCTEKGYEELDVSELNMKLRYSITPASSPMSKSLTASIIDNRTFDTEDYISNVVINENCNLTRSLNSTITRNDTTKVPKSLPLQVLSSESITDNRNTSVLRTLDKATEDQDNDVTITLNGQNYLDDNMSLPSTSSTPEANTPTKEIPKLDGGSPIMRGLKSVLNMFRSSQSPIPSADVNTVKQEILSPKEPLFIEDRSKTHQGMASTPISNKQRDVSSSQRSSPLKDSIVFNDDLERELQWKDETTILFKEEKIPIHKLLLPQSLSSIYKSEVTSVSNCLEKENLNNTVEHMDISYNDSVSDVMAARPLQSANIANTNDQFIIESDGEFVDCETTINNDNISNNKILENLTSSISSQNITLQQSHDLLQVHYEQKLIATNQSETSKKENSQINCIINDISTNDKNGCINEEKAESLVKSHDKISNTVGGELDECHNEIVSQAMEEKCSDHKSRQCEAELINNNYPHNDSSTDIIPDEYLPKDQNIEVEQTLAILKHPSDIPLPDEDDIENVINFDPVMTAEEKQELNLKVDQQMDMSINYNETSMIADSCSQSVSKETNKLAIDGIDENGTNVEEINEIYNQQTVQVNAITDDSINTQYTDKVNVEIINSNDSLTTNIDGAPQEDAIKVTLVEEKLEKNGKIKMDSLDTYNEIHIEAVIIENKEICDLNIHQNENNITWTRDSNQSVITENINEIALDKELDLHNMESFKQEQEDTNIFEKKDLQELQNINCTNDLGTDNTISSINSDEKDFVLTEKLQVYESEVTNESNFENNPVCILAVKDNMDTSPSNTDICVLHDNKSFDINVDNIQTSQKPQDVETTSDSICSLKLDMHLSEENTILDAEVTCSKIENIESIAAGKEILVIESNIEKENILTKEGEETILKEVIQTLKEKTCTDKSIENELFIHILQTNESCIESEDQIDIFENKGTEGDPDKYDDEVKTLHTQVDNRENEMVENNHLNNEMVSNSECVSHITPSDNATFENEIDKKIIKVNECEHETDVGNSLSVDSECLDDIHKVIIPNVTVENTLSQHNVASSSVSDKDYRTSEQEEFEKKKYEQTINLSQQKIETVNITQQDEIFGDSDNNVVLAEAINSVNNLNPENLDVSTSKSDNEVDSNNAFEMSIDQLINEIKETDECLNLLNIRRQENEILDSNNEKNVSVKANEECVINPQNVNNLNINDLDISNVVSNATFDMSIGKENISEDNEIKEKICKSELEADVTAESAINNQNETITNSELSEAQSNTTYIADDNNQIVQLTSQAHEETTTSALPVFLPEQNCLPTKNGSMENDSVDQGNYLDYTTKSLNTDCEIKNNQDKQGAQSMDKSLKSLKIGIEEIGHVKVETESLNKKLEENIEIGDCSEMEIKFQKSPPLSPVISSKGYNFNFDDIEDPFATKTKIRSSPPPEDCLVSNENAIIKTKSANINKKDFQRRKSMPVKRQPPSLKNKINSTFSEAVDCKEIKENTKTTENIDTEIVIKKSTCDNSKVSEKFSSVILGTNSVQTEETNKNIDRITNNESLHKPDDHFTQIETLSDEAEITPNLSNSTILLVDKCETKNVFNLPELSTDMNFSPFATKSRVCRTPSPVLGASASSFKVPSNVKEPGSQLTKANSNIASDVGSKADYDSSIASSSSKETEDATIREVNTEDEDTVEGPFFEADDLNEDEKMSEFVGDCEDMMNFNDVLPQVTEDNADNGEMFIDAEAFEFLLNQNKSNMVVDSGKESLFLKFDPLFAKRMSSDGVLAALNKVQKRQSTPKRISKAPTIDFTCDKMATGTLNLNATTEVNNTLENNFEDPNTTVCKPMMVVNPAVNSIISPRNKPTVTPPRANRRSLTFTSPAIAVIDRLLSLSGNNSMVNAETPTRQARREQNETDLALTQLRELLAEKEIHVHNLRLESKDLKERLSTLETQVRSLESESEQRLRKVNELNGRLVEKSNINRSMAAVVEEYERTIASLIAETEQDKKRHAEERTRLVNERDEQTAHLASMEISFNDLHSKYEKSKQIILACKSNEDTYRKSIKEFEESLLKMQNNYELLKQHATSKLNQANQELERLNRAHEAEVVKLNAMIKRKDLHITSLEETLAQKTKANEELTAICDELINKVG